MLDKIVDSCRKVMKNSKYVKINYSNLEKFIDEIDCTNLKNWLLYNPYNILSLEVEKVINFLLIFESIDYSFWGNPKWTIETEEWPKEGSDALLYSMLNYVKNNNTIDFSNIKLEEFENTLKCNTKIPMLNERYSTVVETSKIVNEKMSGSFYKYIQNITSDKELFNVIITNFPSFKDERLYKGNTVYFYKLAQLLTSDILHIRKSLENIDIEVNNLIGCADYKIS